MLNDFIVASYSLCKHEYQGGFIYSIFFHKSIIACMLIRTRPLGKVHWLSENLLHFDIGDAWIKQNWKIHEDSLINSFNCTNCVWDTKILKIRADSNGPKSWLISTIWCLMVSFVDCFSPIRSLFKECFTTNVPLTWMSFQRIRR